MRLLAQLTRRMWKHAPNLALVEGGDTDPNTWRSIELDRALLRGDWDEAVRLREDRVRLIRSMGKTPKALLEEAAALGERAMSEGRGLDAAIAVARKRVERSHPRAEGRFDG